MTQLLPVFCGINLKILEDNFSFFLFESMLEDKWNVLDGPFKAWFKLGRPVHFSYK
jgi:hypothetical protein